MTTQIKPGDSVVVEIGRGLTKHGSVQRLAENTVYVKHYNGSVVGYKPELVTTLRMVEQTQRSYGTGLSSELAAIQQILESKTSVVVSEEVAEMPANSMSAYINNLDQLTEKKHLTPAEMKKREEVAKAIERENPDMPMDKKMAIATATAKKVAEEAEELDEISTKLLAKAAHAASDPNSDYYYGKSHDPQKFADYAAKKKDAKSAAAVQGAADAKGHYTRPGHTFGYDKLAHRTSSRVTASGKANKQDVKALKGKIQRNEDMHYCAKHVFSERFGEGVVVEGSHAEPNEQGLIEWYDVDFGGTIRRVMTEKVKVMHAEYHMNHKRKMKEEDEMDDKDDMKEAAKTHTVPKTAKEKSLASLAEPKDKITHADVMTGRGVKEEIEEEVGSDQSNSKVKELHHYLKNNPNSKVTGVVRHRYGGGVMTHVTIDNKYEVRHDDQGAKLKSDHDYAKRKITKSLEAGRLSDSHIEHVKEEVVIKEAMISYSDFQSKIDAHKKAGNKIKDDKYDKNKASYTVIDQDGVGKKITHTPAGTKQDHLGQVEKVKDAETQTTEKRGRGRPAGSKSGARN